jgi:hypothetical protein
MLQYCVVAVVMSTYLKKTIDTLWNRWLLLYKYFFTCNSLCSMVFFRYVDMTTATTQYCNICDHDNESQIYNYKMTVYMILIHGSLASKPYIWPLQDIAKCEYSIYLYGSYEARRLLLYKYFITCNSLCSMVFFRYVDMTTATTQYCNICDHDNESKI